MTAFRQNADPDELIGPKLQDYTILCAVYLMYHNLKNSEFVSVDGQGLDLSPTRDIRLTQRSQWQNQLTKAERTLERLAEIGQFL